jgi:hypothetical protein
MKDAILMQLPLLGGDGTIHDWNWLFTQTGLLSWSQLIGTLTYIIGIILIVLSISGMIFFTFKKRNIYGVQ